MDKVIKIDSVDMCNDKKCVGCTPDEYRMNSWYGK